MKTELVNSEKKKEFEPFQILLTFENLEEATRLFYLLSNSYASVADIELDGIYNILKKELNQYQLYDNRT